MLKLVTCLILVLPLSYCGESSHFCNDINDILPKSKLSTKTGYFNLETKENYWNHYKQESENCMPIKVWFYARHGTRYPIGEDYARFDQLPRISEKILYNHLQGRGCLDELDVFEFKKWIPPYEKRDKGQLQEIGAEELYSMGQYWRQLFPSIFEENFNKEKIKVEFTVRNRTQQSAYHFLRGMYGDEAVGTIELPKPYTPNFLLRAYKSCPLWLNKVYKQDSTYRERRLFQNSTLFQTMLHAVSVRLGYLNPIDLEELRAMYDECRYEAAWFPDRKSIWCLPFSQRDIEILEYHEDLKYYYEDSYGTPLNKDISCKTIQDLHQRLKASASSPDDLPNGILYFSHDKAILKLLTALNLHKPAAHLRHNNYSENRIFRTSKFASFASNIGFALYRCGSDLKVVMFLQGNPIPLHDLCPGTLMCDWKNLESFLKPTAESCDITKICMLHDEL